MALILNIETTTTNCSVCIAKEGVVIAHKSLNNKNYSHSESLHVFIEELISEEKAEIIWDIDKTFYEDPYHSAGHFIRKYYNQWKVLKKERKPQFQSLFSSSKEIEIIGLYDPAKNGLNINMWKNSDGYRILDVFNRIEKIKLSKDAAEILNIILLTNSYYPGLNISKEQFLNIKSRWLIKNSNIDLIEAYLLNNQTINDHTELTKYLVNYHLSRSNIEQPCKIFSKIDNTIEDKYLSKFKIYCQPANISSHC